MKTILTRYPIHSGFTIALIAFLIFATLTLNSCTTAPATMTIPTLPPVFTPAPAGNGSISVISVLQVSDDKLGDLNFKDVPSTSNVADQIPLASGGYINIYQSGSDTRAEIYHPVNQGYDILNMLVVKQVAGKIVMAQSADSWVEFNTGAVVDQNVVVINLAGEPWQLVLKPSNTRPQFAYNPTTSLPANP